MKWGLKKCNLTKMNNDEWLCLHKSPKRKDNPITPGGTQHQASNSGTGTLPPTDRVGEHTDEGMETQQADIKLSPKRTKKIADAKGRATVTTIAQCSEIGVLRPVGI
jgi:hypothetical protein